MTATDLHPDLVTFLDVCSNNPADRTAFGVGADLADEQDLPHLAWLMRWLCEHPDTDVLFTGSRRYGTPKPDSDWDWVVQVGRGFRTELRHNAETDCRGEAYPDPKYPGDDRLDIALRFGPVNLICVSTTLQWDVWVEGTNRLVTMAVLYESLGRRRAVTRGQAVGVFKNEYLRQADSNLTGFPVVFCGCGHEYNCVTNSYCPRCTRP